MIENMKSHFLYGNNVEHILFKNAFHFAENGTNVWFISPDPFKELPDGINIIDKEVLKLLTFLYLKDTTELLKALNSIHTWHRIPELIILNNFQIYECNNPDNRGIQLAYISASLLDSCRFCSKKLSKPANIIVGYNKEVNEDKILQNIIDLYYDHVIDVKELSSNGLIDVFSD